MSPCSHRPLKTKIFLPLTNNLQIYLAMIRGKMSSKKSLNNFTVWEKDSTYHWKNSLTMSFWSCSQVQTKWNSSFGNGEKFYTFYTKTKNFSSTLFCLAVRPLQSMKKHSLTLWSTFTKKTSLIILTTTWKNGTMRQLGKSQTIWAYCR